MKKHLTTLFLFAATMMTAFTLSGCGEEVNTDDPKPTGPTEFITEASDGTRTSMDDERYFYWEPTDNIYINTSGTTFFTLLMMFIFGGEVIRGFIFALLVGVVCGMFSSVCLACPIVYEVSKKREAKRLNATK